MVFDQGWSQVWSSYQQPLYPGSQAHITMPGLLIKMESCYFLPRLVLNYGPPISTSQVAEITGVSYCAQV
jgi:hypothetical protein